MAKPTIALSPIIAVVKSKSIRKIPFSAHVRWGERGAPVQFLIRFVETDKPQVLRALISPTVLCGTTEFVG